LKQILDRRLPDEYNYKGYQAPWMQIQLLKILSLLGTDDTGFSLFTRFVISSDVQDL